MAPMSRSISIIIVTFNNEGDIVPCLESILAQNVDCEIIIVDNGSKDSTIELVRKTSDQVRILENHGNLGYAEGNNVGAGIAENEILVIANPDTIFQQDSLINLTKPVSENPKVIATPLIMRTDGRVNVSGLLCSVLGHAFPRGYGLETKDISKLPPANGVSGCCFAIRKEDLKELGGFDPRFFMYNEDTDLSWRAQTEGYRITTVDDSVIIHKYNPNFGYLKTYLLERNRYFLLKKNMPFSWMVILLPSIILMDLFSTIALMRFGFKGLKLKAKIYAEVANFTSNKNTRKNGRLRNSIYPVFSSEPALTGSRYERSIRLLLERSLRANWRLVP